MTSSQGTIGGHNSACAAAASDSASISPVTDQTTTGVVAPTTRVTTASRHPGNRSVLPYQSDDKRHPGARLAYVGRDPGPHCAVALEVHGYPSFPLASGPKQPE